LDSLKLVLLEDEMAGLDLRNMIRREGNETWIKVTPGRVDTFLACYVYRTDMTGRNIGSAQRFLALLETVSGKSLTNPRVLTTCDVYVIVAKDAVKIGISNDTARRVSDLQTGVGNEELALYRTWTLPSASAAQLVERTAHAALKQHQTRREWFSVTPETAAECIDAIISATSEADEAPVPG
jgi:hypothetical protein